ncbi:cyclic lactone autoinducer peptide AgrD [Staphylococcus agnetis]|uniref:Cyclic lactone autoinducer peptide n=1 Tax=Staphylococcus agnetis TaxID=985762 RepID=A0ABD7TYC6_9STAP|nr:cyclic lactone autoinducer peptide [Staphylococcus agnetis]MDG4944178.1 cyclic lactone autoinducer peptide [Staphylococcus agnetis]OSP16299.1 cyclic lactone autoinducer peptide [Staphylococcus agnetis]OSP21629.1 cyclic lactone autoinducer peptide [Staphylococcus agnetis]OTW30146.1 cyclic lactone autoinducer peptide [Staphylococcus agnetis]QDW98376.1 cyclic lactone autoinducer peptide [Staphylococcus agnetis]
MAFFDSLLNLVTISFKSLGNFAKINPCTVFFDEPEVPEELRQGE